MKTICEQKQNNVKQQTPNKKEPTVKTENITEFLKLIDQDLQPIQNNKKEYYYNIPIAFDIETTSFLSERSEKVGIMYCFTFQFMDIVFLGRTWEEFTIILEKLYELYILDERMYLIIYVHNLAFEFQFFRKLLNFKKMFALKKRKPVEVVTENNIIFRCSYLLSGLSLANVGKNVGVSKLKGDLDYSLIRHNNTPITDKEKQYCYNDTQIIITFIWQQIELNQYIYNIPLTNTGYVRKHCRKYTLRADKGKQRINRYSRLIRALTIDNDEYLQLKRAFLGGFTHSNPLCVGKVYNNVISYDIASSYPTVMLCEFFPMSKARYVGACDVIQLKEYSKKYCCIFDLELFEVTPKITQENYISASRCYSKYEVEENNGRVASAKYLKTTTTCIDFEIIEKFYNFDFCTITNLRIYKKGYLPTEFINCIADFYEKKTTLKDVHGEEIEYNKNKGMLNSTYGMAVTSIDRNDIIINEFDEWEEMPVELTEILEKHNKSPKRFLFYPWGVFITAYARKNLFNGILANINNYIYSDTDSIKLTEPNEIYISDYNKNIMLKIARACRYHNINIERFSPKNIKGETKLIGIWEIDKKYTRFKTLGAKRYFYETEKTNTFELDGKQYTTNINLTVSGVAKNNAIAYIVDNVSSEKYFDFFSDDMEIPKGHTGKLTLTYIDEKREGEITDYLGNKAKYISHTSVHAENTSFNMSMSQKFIDYILKVNI